jgi:hypothetical protein
MTEQEQASVAVVQKQLEAYNARDLEGFVSCYSPSVKALSFPSGNVRQGFQDVSFRDRYARLFEASPRLRSEVSQRIVKGNIVIDHEHVFNIYDRQDMTLVVMYQVEAGKISQVWFVE